MKKILTLLNTNFIMLTRQRGLIISSLGLAVISMLVFGFIFGGSGSPKTLLGVVDQDHSAISAQIVSQLQQSDALQVYRQQRRRTESHLEKLIKAFELGDMS
jgi:ABC-2 type transport system permease protein